MKPCGHGVLVCTLLVGDGEHLLHLGDFLSLSYRTRFSQRLSGDMNVMCQKAIRLIRNCFKITTILSSTWLRAVDSVARQLFDGVEASPHPILPGP